MYDFFVFKKWQIMVNLHPEVVRTVENYRMSPDLLKGTSQTTDSQIAVRFSVNSTLSDLQIFLKEIKIWLLYYEISK